MKEETIESSAAEVGKISILPPFNLPPLPDASDIKEIIRRGEEVRRRAKQVGEWVVTVLVFLARIAGLGREEQESLPTPPRELKKELEKLLHQDPIPAIRRAAWMALFKHYLIGQPTSTEQVKKILSTLVEREYLVVSDSVACDFQAFNIAYTVPPDSYFENPEMETLRDLVEDLIQAAVEQEQSVWREETTKLLAEGQLSVQEFLDGEEGLFAIRVPPQPVINPHSGKTILWRHGGTLLLRSEDGKAYPVRAVGKIAAAMEEARDLGVFLVVSDLQHDKPPYMQGFTPNQGKKLTLLWHLLKRGIAARAKKEQTEKATEQT